MPYIGRYNITRHPVWLRKCHQNASLRYSMTPGLAVFQERKVFPQRAIPNALPEYLAWFSLQCWIIVYSALMRAALAMEHIFPIVVQTTWQFSAEILHIDLLKGSRYMHLQVAALASRRSLAPPQRCWFRADRGRAMAFILL